MCVDRSESLPHQAGARSIQRVPHVNLESWAHMNFTEELATIIRVMAACLSMNTGCGCHALNLAYQAVWHKVQL